jgi:hypothetical protein
VSLAASLSSQIVTATGNKVTAIVILLEEGIGPAGELGVGCDAAFSLGNMSTERNIAIARFIGVSMHQSVRQACADAALAFDVDTVVTTEAKR